MRTPTFLLLLLPSLAAQPATTEPSDLPARCQALAERWRARFDREGLHCLVAPPYVIASDGSAGAITAYRDHTVLAAAESLQRAFFAQAPRDPILILLFESEAPYRRLAREWFGDDDVSPYGY